MEIHSKISKGGRIVLPRNFRKALNLKDGESIIIRLNENGIHLFSLNQAIKNAQEKVQGYNDSKKLLSEELFNLRKEDQTYE